MIPSLGRGGALLAALLCGACARPAASPDSIAISVPFEVDSLDPHAQDSLSHIAVVSNLYEPLVTTDADMKLRPGLARSWETPDPFTWVFHLRPGVTFHGGERLEAGDVVYSIRRLLESPELQMRGYLLYVGEAEALDPLTVRIQVTQPLGVLPNRLRFVSIVRRGAAEEDLAARPNGTGPYALADWTPGERIRLTRHERYWGSQPPLGRVEILLDRSPEQAAQDLLSGRSHLASCSLKRAGEALAASERFELLRRPSLYLHYLAFDVAREVTPHAGRRPNPFRDRLVRQAIHLAIDRSRLTSDLPTAAIPAAQPVLPFVFGFNPRIPEPVPDLARARELLRRAGLEGGVDATLHVRKTFADAATLVRDQLLSLGVRLDVDVAGEAEFRARTVRRDTSLLLSRFGATTGDASELLEACLHTPDEGRGLGTFNFGGYSSSAVDRAIEQSAGIEALHRRRATLEGALQIVMEDLPVLPLYFAEDVYALDTRYAWRPRYDSLVLAAEIAPRSP